MFKKTIFPLGIFLFSCFSITAQEPLQQYTFTMHKTGFVAGETSVSPSGRYLLATFNNLDKTAVYELVDLFNMRLVSSGSLEAKPYQTSWSADSKYLLMEHIYHNPVLYNMSSGLGKVVTLSRPGKPVFKPVGSWLDSKPKDPEIFVFNDQTAYHFNIQGKLLDSVDQDEYHSVSVVWFNYLQQKFTVMNNEGFDTYSPDGEYLGSRAVTGLDVYKSCTTDNDGATVMLYDRNGFTRYDVATGKIIQQVDEKSGLDAACITPDKKNVMYKGRLKLTLVYDNGVKTTIVLRDYFSRLFYTGFGSLLVAVNPEEIKIYGCSNYLPKPTPPKPAPPVVVKKEPVPEVKKTPAVPAKPKWNQPYTVADFITPKTSDSFYLYTADRGLKYFIKYTKGEPNILWPNPFFYSQFMGFAGEQKYQSYYTYLLDNTDGEARMGTYAYGSAYGSKEQMVGGPNFLAKIPAAGQTLSWKNKLYEDEYTLTAQVVDMVYKGKPKKFLSVSRGGTYNGQPIDESWYYQLGVGLTFIKSGGKIVYERSF